MQGSGSQASIAIWDEVTYGVRPVTPAMQKIKAATEGVGLKGTVEKLTSKALSSARGIASSRGGNITVGGSIPFEMPLLGIGKLMKHAIGVPAAPVAVKLVSLAAGLVNVIALYAETATPAGAGLLTKTGTTLIWTANGDTAGAAVDVSAGGEFTLQSGTVGHALSILVTGAVTGASAIPTVGAAAYKHVISRGALPVGFGAEIAYADIAQYQGFDGLKIESLACNVSNSGLVTGTVNIVGQSSTPPAGVASGTPTSVAHVPFAHHEVLLMEGGAAADVTAFSFDIKNELDPVRPLSGRTISSLREGMGDASGKISTLFQDATMINKVINETASSLRAFFGASDGSGSVMFKFPNVKYYGDIGVGIPSAKGIIQSNDFQADNSVGGTDIIVTIINSEATI